MLNCYLIKHFIMLILFLKGNDTLIKSPLIVHVSNVQSWICERLLKSSNVSSGRKNLSPYMIVTIHT